MQPTVVIVNGFPRSGKDETVKQTVIHLRDMGINAAQFSSIDPFRHAVEALGLDPHKKTPAMRALLSEWKASADKHFDFSTQQVANQCRATFNANNGSLLNERVAFTFIREPHNIAKLKEALKHDEMVVLAVLVKSDRSETVDSNTSDTDVENYEYDVVINNNGTIEDLADGCFDLASRIARKPSARSAKAPVDPSLAQTEAN